MNERAAIRYALTDDGIELPVIDVTHAAFHVSDARQAELTEEFVERDTPISRLLFRLPKRVRRAIMRRIFAGSRLGAEIQRSEGTFLSGMGTYLLKLGPDDLGAWAKPIDRRLVTSLPALSMKWRLRDVSQLVAEAIERVAGSARPLQLVNIAGGPAVDSLNAIAIAHRRRSLEARAITISVLDADEHGPSFGRRALEAWKARGGPLDGLQVAMERVPYDWNRPSELARAIQPGADVVVSSEGGLFEYGNDDVVTSNLDALRGRVVAVVGSVTRADGPTQIVKRQGSAATIPRGLDAFRRLASRAGFEVERAIARPFSDQVLLVSRA